MRNVLTTQYNYSQQAARYNSENVVVVNDAPDVAAAFASNWRDVTAKGSPYVTP